jgi:hypothetical protein
MKNEILEELWKTRKEIEKDYSGDLLKVFKSMKRKTSVSKRKVYGGAAHRKKVTGQGR